MITKVWHYLTTEILKLNLELDLPTYQAQADNLSGKLKFA